MLGLATTGAAVSLSGCLDAFARYLGANEEGEFVVASVNLRRPTGTDDSRGTPADIAVRVDIENRRPERVRGRLEVELRYVPDGETERQWSKTDQLEVGGGVPQQKQYIFEDAYQSGSVVPGDYETDAEIVEIETVES